MMHVLDFRAFGKFRIYHDKNVQQNISRREISWFDKEHLLKSTTTIICIL